MLTKQLSPFLLILTLLAFFQTLTAQSTYQVERAVVATAGYTLTAAGKTIECTVGEVAVATLQKTDQTLFITQGFHQPPFAPAMVDATTSLQAWGIQVFPNPTTETLYLHAAQSIDHLQLQATIIDVNGNAVMAVRNTSAPIDCSALPAGYYTLYLYSKKEAKSTVVPFIKTK